VGKTVKTTIEKIKIVFNRVGKKEIIFLVILVLSASFLRFTQLGYSHFYGDETKALYLNKSIPAADYFFEQRKGPMQFVITWVVEKAIGGYSELWMRLPFAIAGLLSVGIFYLLVRRIFNWQIVALSSFLFAFGGFNIAFSRTVQYQAFLVLFGLIAVWLFWEGLECKKENLRKGLFIASALALTGSFYSHYDAIFFLVPIAYLLVEKIRESSSQLKPLFIYFVIPFIASLGVFYLPYILSDYFSNNTVEYITRRFTGASFIQNNSFYTFRVYNPTLLFTLVLLPSLMVFFETWSVKVKALFLWFFVPFVSFQFVISNPGTHIHNYFIPIYILSGFGLWSVYEKFNPIIKKLYIGVVSFVFLLLFIVASLVYIPFLNQGYPWTDSEHRLIKLQQADKSYHLYLYGFPYYRGWDDVTRYFNLKSEITSVYTNDNDTIAHYYLKGIPYIRPNSKNLPTYFIDIRNNQEILTAEETFFGEYGARYAEERIFYDNDGIMAVIYRKKGH
jgi:hypothetical protein